MVSLVHLLPRPPVMWQVWVLPCASATGTGVADMGGSCLAKEAVQISCMSSNVD